MKTVVFYLWSVLAALCLLYGMVVARAGSGTGFFVVWIGLGVMFAGFAAASKFHLWENFPKWLKNGFLGIVVVGVVLFLIIEKGVVSGFFEEGKDNLDYIIVLGAQVRESGPSVVLKYRLDRAIDYLEENPNTKCIVSGGQGANEPFAEAVGMADYLKKNGIDEKRIIVEAESRTTEENIKNSKTFLEEDASVGIITNDFHVFRALQMAEEQGLSEARGIAADSSKLYLPNNMLREFFAEIKHLVGLVVKK